MMLSDKYTRGLRVHRGAAVAVAEPEPRTSSLRRPVATAACIRVSRLQAQADLEYGERKGETHFHRTRDGRRSCRRGGTGADRTGGQYDGGDGERTGNSGVHTVILICTV